MMSTFRLLYFPGVAFGAGLRRLLLPALFTLATAVFAAESVPFDQPAQPLPAALVAVAHAAGVQVLFSHQELKDLTAPALKGLLEPAEALARLLAGSGYVAVAQGSKQFLIRRDTSGAIRGVLLWPEGGPAEGVYVSVRSTTLAVVTDRYGQYLFSEVPAGTYVLEARAEGFQPLHLTSVVVTPRQELILTRQTMRKGDPVTKLAPFEVKAEAVTELARYEVTDSKARPFADGNVDLPRTINDVQPYYIFDSKTIDASGAANVEDFLKQRLTTDTTARTAGSSAGSYVGTSSSVNLRGLGTDQTLILIDGRRMSGVSFNGTDYQPDLNGIPMGAIDRIEVLPTSASALYGSNALGGVVNVILKNNFVGGDLRLTYDNTFDTDSARRSVGLNYGLALEGGRTHVRINGAWSDGHGMMYQDRPDIFVKYYRSILNNYPALFTSASPLLGSLPNISPVSTAVTSLVLKNGTSLKSTKTYVAAGTSPSTSMADLSASLLANAGSWNSAMPPTPQYYGGLQQFSGTIPVSKSFGFNLQRQMAPWWSLETGFTHAGTTSSTPYMSLAAVTVAATAPSNPFTVPVRIQIPATADGRIMANTATWNGLLAATFHPSAETTLMVDYNHSEYLISGFSLGVVDSQALAADINAGLINPFVDTLKYPINLKPYFEYSPWKGHNLVDALAGRGSHTYLLPWGQAQLGFRGEHVVNRSKGNSLTQIYYNAYDSANSERIEYFPTRSTDDSFAVESEIPLIKTGWRPGLRGLELQLAGRTESFRASTGTTGQTVFFNKSPATVSYSGSTLNGAPFVGHTTYASTNYTAGLKYTPFRDLYFRLSTGTAFLPPTSAQLTKNAVQSTTTTNVSDPKTGATTAVYTLGGGNPDLKPQHSRDQSFGAVWQPSWRLLKGLRLDVEYRITEEDDAIGTLSAQQIVNLESLYPDRVTRNANGTITLVDISNLNLYKRETHDWEFTLDYSRPTGWGTFTAGINDTWMTHLRKQVSLTLPTYDYAGYNPAEGGTPTNRATAYLTWEWQRWSLGWNARYTNPYKAYGAPGSPLSQQYASGGVYRYYITAMGGRDTISSQIYHDFFVSYAFARTGMPAKSRGAAGLLDGLTVQVGVRNLFNAEPPFDASTDLVSYGAASPYGDARLRSYWITLKKTF